MKPKNSWFATVLFHNDVKHGKHDVRRNLIGLKRAFIIADQISNFVYLETAFDLIMNKVYYCKTHVQHSGTTAQEFDTDIF